MTAHVLIVEDDPDLTYLVRTNLAAEGYCVDAVADGTAAVDAVARRQPDLILLDLMIPKRSGMEVLCDIRRVHPRLPIIIMTARSEVTERVQGLRLGADDYVTKPFEMAELLARVDAVLRRSTIDDDLPNVIDVGPVQVNFSRMEATSGTEVVALSSRECRILRALARQRGRAVSRDDLLLSAWSRDEAVTARTVDAHIKNLRKKIEPDPGNPVYIRTMHREGYVLMP